MSMKLHSTVCSASCSSQKASEFIESMKVNPLNSKCMSLDCARVAFYDSQLKIIQMCVTGAQRQHRELKRLADLAVAGAQLYLLRMGP